MTDSKCQNCGHKEGLHLLNYHCVAIGNAALDTDCGCLKFNPMADSNAGQGEWNKLAPADPRMIQFTENLWPLQDDETGAWFALVAEESYADRIIADHTAAHDFEQVKWERDELIKHRQQWIVDEAAYEARIAELEAALRQIRDYESGAANATEHCGCKYRMAAIARDALLVHPQPAQQQDSARDNEFTHGSNKPNA